MRPDPTHVVSSGDTVCSITEGLTAQDVEGRPRPDAGVSPIGTVIRDVTDRRRSEALLAAQKQSLELVVTGAPLDVVLTHLVRTVEEQAGGTVTASILLLDDESRLRNGASPGLEPEYLQAIDGLPADANLGTCCAAAALRQVVVTRSFTNDSRWQGLSHLPMAYGFVAAWSMPILARDGSVLGTFGTYFRECRGPTPVECQVVEVLARTASIAIERGRAEAALREREAFNRRLVESSGDCIKVLDLEGRIQSMNEAGRRLMRIDDVGCVIGRDYRDFWREEDRPAVERALSAAAAGREGRFEGFCPTVAGEPRWWDVLATAISDATGAPYRLLVISRDVTERHETQNKLKRAMAEAEAANHAKSQFLAVMSHELRTPLTGIIGYADLVGSGISGKISDQQQVHVSRIKAGAWHLVSIIDEILTFSRVEAGKEQVTLETIDLVECVRESAVLLQPQAAAKGVALRFVGPEHPLKLETDAGKLRQIVLNLAGNAVKFTDEGYVELRIEEGREDVTLTVRDSGPGIPVAEAARVFEPFVQVDQSNTRAKGGTGLGLTVSRTLAQLLGGDVSLAFSEPGAGSTFALRLPRMRARGKPPESLVTAAP